MTLNMANRRSAPAPAPTGRPKRESSKDIRARGGIPFLRAEDAKDGETFALIGFNNMKERNTDREQIVCQVENDKGETFNLGVRTGSPDHSKLFRALGHAWQSWRGSVTVTLVNGRRDRTVQFVNVKDVSRDLPFWYENGDDAPPHTDDDAPDTTE